MEFSLLWAAVTAVGAMALGERFLVRSHGGPDGLFDRLLVASLIGLAVGRLTAMIVNGVNPVTNPVDLIIVRGGVHTGTAAVGALVAFVVAERSRLWWVADAAAGPALIGLAGWHVGCLFRRACLGTPSSLPWAFAQPGSDITRHPVELYAAGLLLAGGVVLARRWQRAPSPAGMVGAAGLLVAAGVRLVTEPLRPALLDGPRAWYAAGVAAGLAGMAASVAAAFRKQPGGPPPPPDAPADPRPDSAPPGE